MSDEERFQEMRVVVKDVRKEMLAEQLETFQKVLHENRAIVENHVAIQKEFVQKRPVYKGEWYPKKIDPKDPNTLVIEPLEFQKPIPRFTQWTTLRRNYRVDDDPVLRFLPYFGDEDNETFDYLSYYDSTSLLEEDKEDEFRIQLTSRILPKFGIEDEKILNFFKEKNSSSEPQPSFQISNFFESLGKVLKFPPESLIEKYVEYIGNKNRPSEASLVTENLDNPKNEINEEQVLDSFSNLLCRRCFRYDCQLHGLGSDNQDKNKGRNMEQISDIQVPCGPDCFKLLKEKPGEPPQKKMKETAAWTNVETILLLKAKEVFHKSNFCSISAFISTKKCFEVFNFIRESEGPETLNDNEHQSPQEDKPKQKKRKRKYHVGRSQSRRFPNPKRGDGDSESLIEYTPCTHDGPCDEKCNCVHSNNYCEKYCLCDASCKNRFPGCRCRRMCDTRQCPCYAALRECDPDVCLSCGAAEDFHTLLPPSVINSTLNSNSNSPQLNSHSHSHSPHASNLHFNSISNSSVPSRSPSISSLNIASPNSPANRMDIDQIEQRTEGIDSIYISPNLKSNSNSSLNLNSSSQLNLNVSNGNLTGNQNLLKRSYNSNQLIRCRNVALQRNFKKHTVVGESDIAGWGLFLREPAKKNDLIGEYMGEIISQEEADRRGKVYDKHAISFLFNLNQDYCVDAHRKGNKLRFANHSVNPNCYARVTMVNGDYRIGIFAKYDIHEGEELFFDYRYGDEALKFVPVEHNVIRRDQEQPSESGNESDTD